MRCLGKHQNWSKKVLLSSTCISELTWWSRNLGKAEILTKSLDTPSPSQEIFTDNSGYGYGSVLGHLKHQGLFTEKQRSLSINSKELLAIYFTLNVYAKQLAGEHIMLRCDNYTAIYCIVHRGSKDQFCDYITGHIFDLAHKYRFTLQISYVKSKENCSDVISRKFNRLSVHSEWSLDERDYKKFAQWWIVTPEIDMFASNLNNKCNKFFSWLPCPDSIHVDAFTCSWSELRGFLFPPCLDFQMRVENVQRQNTSSVRGLSKMGNQKLVARTNEVSGRKSACIATRNQLKTTNPMESDPSPPPQKKTSLNFCEFINSLLKKSKLFSSQCKHIAKNAWRKATQEQMNTQVKRWTEFCDMYQHTYFDITFAKVMGFLEYLQDQKINYTSKCKGRRMLNVALSLVGKPLTESQNAIIRKFLTAFNTNPPIMKKHQETWDASILLDYLVAQGHNEQLTFAVLSGKLSLLILLTQSCHTSEIMQLDLKHMRVYKDKIEFTLPVPTKTFNERNYKKTQGLQKMSIRKFRGDTLLCPLTTLMSYLNRTNSVCGNVTQLFILLTSGDIKVASQTTVVRWSKNIMTGNGLGDFKMHSTRSASSTHSLLMGTSLDNIMCNVGWQRASTFITSYMKPVVTRDIPNEDTLADLVRGKEVPYCTVGNKNVKVTLDKQRAPIKLKPPTWLIEKPVPKPAIVANREARMLQDKHNFHSVMQDKMPRLRNAVQNRALHFTSNYVNGERSRPVYALVMAPASPTNSERSIALDDVTELIKNDPIHGLHLDSPPVVENNMVSGSQVGARPPHQVEPTASSSLSDNNQGCNDGNTNTQLTSAIKEFGGNTGVYTESVACPPLNPVRNNYKSAFLPLLQNMPLVPQQKQVAEEIVPAKFINGKHEHGTTTECDVVEVGIVNNDIVHENYPKELQGTGDFMHAFKNFVDESLDMDVEKVGMDSDPLRDMGNGVTSLLNTLSSHTGEEGGVDNNIENPVAEMQDTHPQFNYMEGQSLQKILADNNPQVSNWLRNDDVSRGPTFTGQKHPGTVPKKTGRRKIPRGDKNFDIEQYMRKMDTKVDMVITKMEKDGTKLQPGKKFPRRGKVRQYPRGERSFDIEQYMRKEDDRVEASLAKRERNTSVRPSEWTGEMIDITEL